MFKLNLKTLGARVVMTVFATAAWTIVVAIRGGMPAFWLVFMALAGIFAISLSIRPLSSRLNRGSDLSPRATTTTEFALYLCFISTVTFSSLLISHLSPAGSFWYEIPIVLTLGIVPQIENWKYKLGSIAISVLVYLAIVQFMYGDLKLFSEKDLFFHYLALGAVAFSVEITNGLLAVLMRLFDRLVALLSWMGNFFQGVVDSSRNISEDDKSP